MRVGSGLVANSRIGTGISRVKASIGQVGQPLQPSGRQSHFYSNFKQSQGLSQIQKSSPQGMGIAQPA